MSDKYSEADLQLDRRSFIAGSVTVAGMALAVSEPAAAQTERTGAAPPTATALARERGSADD
ncbi:MAG TPA: hypothetical protein VFB99_22060, partial [Vicinamibacterales bacterium]|nr:hypothetical protein [Vicinamibacterales bacterium]